MKVGVLFYIWLIRFKEKAKGDASIRYVKETGGYNAFSYIVYYQDKIRNCSNRLFGVFGWKENEQYVIGT